MDRQSQIDFILDHYENPRNYGEMADADVYVEGGNPGCGDLITIYLKAADEELVKISYVGEGCTISQAAASMLTEIAAGRSLEALQDLDHQVMVDALGEESVRTRPRCATLALDVLKAAIRLYRKQRLLGPSEPESAQ